MSAKETVVTVFCVVVVALLLLALGAALKHAGDENRDKVRDVTITCIEQGHGGAIKAENGLVCVG